MKRTVLLADPLYDPLLEPCEPALGRAQDFVLHWFGQQIPPICEQSVSCVHFGVQVVIWDDNGQSPKSEKKMLIVYISNMTQMLKNHLLNALVEIARKEIKARITINFAGIFFFLKQNYLYTIWR